MTPCELLNIIDSGVVEELTMYYRGHKTVVNLRDLPEVMPDYQIAKIWNSETDRGISILLADEGYLTVRGNE